MMIETIAIDLGDSVRLNKLNGVYTTFSVAFKRLGFKSLKTNPENVLSLKELKGDFFKVFAIGKKDFEQLVGIRNSDGVELLVERRAITVVRKRRVFLDNDTL